MENAAHHTSHPRTGQEPSQVLPEEAPAVLWPLPVHGVSLSVGSRWHAKIWPKSGEQHPNYGTTTNQEWVYNTWDTALHLSGLSFPVYVMGALVKNKEVVFICIFCLRSFYSLDILTKSVICKCEPQREFWTFSTPWRQLTEHFGTTQR